MLYFFRLSIQPESCLLWTFDSCRATLCLDISPSIHTLDPVTGRFIFDNLFRGTVLAILSLLFPSRVAVDPHCPVRFRLVWQDRCSDPTTTNPTPTPLSCRRLNFKSQSSAFASSPSTPICPRLTPTSSHLLLKLCFCSNRPTCHGYLFFLLTSFLRLR